MITLRILGIKDFTSDSKITVENIEFDEEHPCTDIFGRDLLSLKSFFDEEAWTVIYQKGNLSIITNLP